MGRREEEEEKTSSSSYSMDLQVLSLKKEKKIMIFSLPVSLIAHSTKSRPFNFFLANRSVGIEVMPNGHQTYNTHTHTHTHTPVCFDETSAPW